MPELPEVETIVRDLKKVLPGLQIKDVVVYGDYKPKARDLASVINSTISSVNRVAKTTHIGLDNGLCLVFHLGMTGRLLIRKSSDPEDSHQRVGFVLPDERELRFTDLRMFGWVDLFREEHLENFNKRFGPDPFKIDAEEFASRIISRNTSIKNALLDQSLVSGIGNIYANDALWVAEVHPETKTRELSAAQLKALHEAVLEVLTEGIEHRGSSIDSYVDAYGKPGSHQHYFRVYGKAKEKCVRCGGVIQFRKLGGRGTFYCEGCQVRGLGKGSVVKTHAKGQGTLKI